MRTAAALLFASACTGTGIGDPDDTGQPARNGLLVAFVLDERPEDLDDLTVRVGAVVFDGKGPSGRASVTVEAATEIEMLGGVREPLVLELEVGGWSDVTLRVDLTSAGDVPALSAAGEEDGRAFELVVPSLSFAGTGRFELGDGVDPQVTVDLEAEDWFEDLEIEEDGGEEEPIRISPDSHPAAYERVLQRIREGIHVQFPGDPDRDEDEGG